MTVLHALAKGVDHPAPLRHRVPGWLVVSGLFAAPAAWSLQLLVSYCLNGDICPAGGRPAGPSLGATSAVVAAIGVVAVGTCLFGLWSSRQTWKLTRREGPGDHHEGLTAGLGRTRFLGLSGMVAGAIFLIASLFALLVPLLVSPCAALFL
jgi:hypothetical protein